MWEEKFKQYEIESKEQKRSNVNPDKKKAMRPSSVSSRLFKQTKSS